MLRSLIGPRSEGMGAVGADREKELEQELVLSVVRVAERRAAVLPADQAELARPVAEQERATRVADSRVVGALRVVVAQAGRPAPAELVLDVAVAAGRRLRGYCVLAAAPCDLTTSEQVCIDRASERLPAQRGVDAPEPGGGVGGHAVVAVRERAAQVDVG